MCSSFQFQMTKKGGVICKFKMEFEKSFYCGFYLSNDDIISLLCKHVMLRFVTTSRSENGHGFQRPGLKTGGEIDIFVCNRVRRTGRHTPTKNTQECPLPGTCGRGQKQLYFHDIAPLSVLTSVILLGRSSRSLLQVFERRIPRKTERHLPAGKDFNVLVFEDLQ